MHVGILIFPGMTQLDATGPYEVLARIPGAEVHLLAEDLAPVTSEFGLSFVPTIRLSQAPQLDILLVPGGGGIDKLLDNEPICSFVAAQGHRARYVTSVCTGALLLGAAGLLRGYRATTHWLSLDLLGLFGAIPTEERVVIDRNRVTGAGITSGIDFGLTLAAELAGEAVARRIQLMLEYAPAPPYASGSPHSADPRTVAEIRTAREQFQRERRRICERVANRF